MMPTLTVEGLHAAQWVLARLATYMNGICKPDDPDWRELKRARLVLLGIPIPETEPHSEIPGETK